MLEILIREQKKRNLSDSKIARMADINQSDYSMMKNGKKPCFPAWRKRISLALEIPEAMLFPEYEEKSKAGA